MALICKGRKSVPKRDQVRIQLNYLNQKLDIHQQIWKRQNVTGNVSSGENLTKNFLGLNNQSFVNIS